MSCSGPPTSTRRRSTRCCGPCETPDSTRCPSRSGSRPTAGNASVSSPATFRVRRSRRGRSRSSRVGEHRGAAPPVPRCPGEPRHAFRRGVERRDGGSLGRPRDLSQRRLSGERRVPRRRCRRAPRLRLRGTRTPRSTTSRSSPRCGCRSTPTTTPPASGVAASTRFVACASSPTATGCRRIAPSSSTSSRTRSRTARTGGFVRRQVERGHPAFVAMAETMGGLDRYERRHLWFEANRQRFADALWDEVRSDDGMTGARTAGRRPVACAQRL